MDINTWAPVIVAIVAAIPGALALYYQGRKDKREGDLNMNNAAQAAAVSMLAPLQAEVQRLQARVAELEQALIDKTNQIGQLMVEGIDKDAKYRSLQSTVAEMQLKLSAFETAKETTKERNVVMAHKKQEIAAEVEDEVKKQKIVQETQSEIEKLTSGSILNGSASTKET